MSDATTPRASRVRTWLLVGSVGLNLLVVGLAVTVVTKPAGPRIKGDHQPLATSFVQPQHRERVTMPAAGNCLGCASLQCRLSHAFLPESVSMRCSASGRRVVVLACRARRSSPFA